jgi:hypothetical protein
VHDAGSVSLDLVEVLFSSSLSLGPFGVKVVTNLGDDFLQNSCPRGAVPPPPPPCLQVNLEQLLATPMELMVMLVDNDARHGAGCSQHPRHQDMESSYSNFLMTHLSLFIKPTYLLEADNWIHTTESKFGLLHCIEYHKTLYAVQQVRGSVGAWWTT